MFSSVHIIYIALALLCTLSEFTSLPDFYRTVGPVDWKNPPDRPQFHQTDTIREKMTKREQLFKCTVFLNLCDMMKYKKTIGEVLLLIKRNGCIRLSLNLFDFSFVEK